jgi:hypothetical protein
MYKRVERLVGSSAEVCELEGDEDVERIVISCQYAIEPCYGKWVGRIRYPDP